MMGGEWKPIAGGGGSAPTDVLKYTEQSLTDEQKAQARENIGAAEAGNSSGEGIDVSNIPEILQPRFAYYYSSGMHPTYVMVGFPDYTTDEYSQYYTYEYAHEGDEYKSYIFNADACNWEYSTIDNLEANFDSLIHPQRTPYPGDGMLVILCYDEELSREEFLEGPVSTSLRVYYDSETEEYYTAAEGADYAYVRLNNQLFTAFMPYMD